MERRVMRQKLPRAEEWRRAGHATIARGHSILQLAHFLLTLRITIKLPCVTYFPRALPSEIKSFQKQDSICPKIDPILKFTKWRSIEMGARNNFGKFQNFSKKMNNKSYIAR